MEKKYLQQLKNQMNEVQRNISKLQKEDPDQFNEQVEELNQNKIKFVENEEISLVIQCEGEGNDQNQQWFGQFLKGVDIKFALEKTNIYETFFTFIRVGNNDQEAAEVGGNLFDVIEVEDFKQIQQINTEIERKINQNFRERKQKNEIEVKQYRDFSKRKNQTESFLGLTIEFQMKKYKEYEDDIEQFFFKQFIFDKVKLSKKQQFKIRTFIRMVCNKVDKFDKQLGDLDIRFVLIGLCFLKLPVYYKRCQNKKKPLVSQELFDLCFQSIKTQFYYCKENDRKYSISYFDLFE